MKAVDCENCGRSIGRLETPEIIDGHVVCVECAVRLRPPPLAYRNLQHDCQQPMQIELTSRKWKKTKLIGALTLCGGGIFAYAGAVNNIIAIIVIGVTIGLAGLAIVIDGWIGSWWEHG